MPLPGAETIMILRSGSSFTIVNTFLICSAVDRTSTKLSNFHNFPTFLKNQKILFSFLISMVI